MHCLYGKAQYQHVSDFKQGKSRFVIHDISAHEKHVVMTMMHM